MWNVYQYVKDFGNDKIDFNEFINIYQNQKVLRNYISDSYLDVVKHKLNKEYTSIGGALFPNKYLNIHEFIINNKNIEEIRKCLSALAMMIDKIYK